MDDNFLKETGLNDKDMQDLREAYVSSYSSKKGWDKDNLTSEQLLEIQQQTGYKNPGMLKS